MHWALANDILLIGNVMDSTFTSLLTSSSSSRRQVRKRWLCTETLHVDTTLQLFQKKKKSPLN